LLRKIKDVVRLLMQAAKTANASIPMPFLLKYCRNADSGKKGIRRSGVKNSNENKVASTTCFRVTGIFSVIRKISMIVVKPIVQPSAKRTLAVRIIRPQLIKTSTELVAANPRGGKADNNRGASCCRESYCSEISSGALG
jgi:hypothetical protein